MRLGESAEAELLPTAMHLSDERACGLAMTLLMEVAGGTPALLLRLSRSTGALAAASIARRLQTKRVPIGSGCL